MNPGSPTPFSIWQNFYVIVGSSAGALTGVQFVVIALIAQTRAPGNMRDVRAFGTPTVVHFCTALFISALMVAPWPTTLSFDISLAVYGVAGIAYSIRVLWHARKATYNPDLEDWIWYTALPLVAHLAIAVAAGMLWWNRPWSLFLIAADTLLFLLLGIRNAWDTVTYIAIKHGNQPSPREENELD